MADDADNPSRAAGAARGQLPPEAPIPLLQQQEADVVSLYRDGWFLIARSLDGAPGEHADEGLAPEVVAITLPVRVERPAGQVARIIHKVRTEDGSSAEVELASFALALPSGERLALTFGRDVTDQLALERELMESERRLRESQRVARIGTWELEIETGVLTWSEEIYRIFEVDPERFTPSYEGFLELVHPEDRARVHDSYSRSMRQRTPYEIRHRLLTPDGRIKHVNECGESFYDQTGRPLRSLGTVRDVTDRVHTEGKLELAQRLEALGRLAGGLAHDFNNILMVILGLSSELESVLSQAPTARRLVRDIHDAGTRAAELTRQLLAFARKQPSLPVLVDVKAQLTQFARFLGRVLGHDVELELSVSDESCLVLLGPSALEQVVLNLAVNARDAMPNGGRLQISCAPVRRADLGGAERFVEIAVRDEGLGMSEAVRARIFEPFFTTKAFGHGTGLGLANVYGLVKQAGGHIEVDSVPGAGTAFRIYLPEVCAAQDEAVAEVRGGSEAILVVEDEREVRDLMVGILREAGYLTLGASNALEAERLDESAGGVDLLICDVVLPGGGIRIATEFARKQPSRPVLLVTGYTNDATDLEKLGRLLIKPFTREALLSVVRKLLDEAHD